MRNPVIGVPELVELDEELLELDEELLDEELELEEELVELDDVVEELDAPPPVDPPHAIKSKFKEPQNAKASRRV